MLFQDLMQETYFALKSNKSHWTGRGEKHWIQYWIPWF